MTEVVTVRGATAAAATDAATGVVVVVVVAFTGGGGYGHYPLLDTIKYTHTVPSLSLSFSLSFSVLTRSTSNSEHSCRRHNIVTTVIIVRINVCASAFVTTTASRVITNGTSSTINADNAAEVPEVSRRARHCDYITRRLDQ